MGTRSDVKEQSALRWSAAACFTIGLVAVVFSSVSGSRAILLDGLFNLTYFATGLFTIRVTQLLARGDTSDYPLGYGYYEPLTNGIKGVLVLGMSGMAGIDAAMALATGGRTIEPGPAIAYGAFASIVGWALAAVLHRLARSTPSPLVRADAENWVVNAVISSGVLGTFLTILAIRGTAFEAWLPYVDPGLVLVITATCIFIPIRAAYHALMRLLNRTPREISERVEAAVTEAMAGLPVAEMFVRVLQPGRTRMVWVHVVVEAGCRVEDFAELDTVRENARTSLTRDYDDTILDMLFTADRRWAAPQAELL